MRASRFSLAVALAIAFVPASAYAAPHDVAPADEYFGPFKESILGIRNRLGAFEGRPDADLLIATTLAGIDNVEVAMEDWHSRYPRDPWLPKFFNRLVHVYVRAHAAGDRCAQHAFAILERDYAASSEAIEARRAMGETP